MPGTETATTFSTQSAHGSVMLPDLAWSLLSVSLYVLTKDVLSLESILGCDFSWQDALFCHIKSTALCHVWGGWRFCSKRCLSTMLPGVQRACTYQCSQPPSPLSSGICSSTGQGRLGWQKTLCQHQIVQVWAPALILGMFYCTALKRLFWEQHIQPVQGTCFLPGQAASSACGLGVCWWIRVFLCSVAMRVVETTDVDPFPDGQGESRTVSLCLLADSRTLVSCSLCLSWNGAATTPGACKRPLQVCSVSRGSPVGHLSLVGFNVFSVQFLFCWIKQMCSLYLHYIYCLN